MTMHTALWYRFNICSWMLVSHIASIQWLANIGHTCLTDDWKEEICRIYSSCIRTRTISLLSRTKIHVKQVLIDYSINTNFTIMASIIMINNFKWGCLAIGIFQKYQLDHKFLCLLHTNKLPDICTVRSRLKSHSGVYCRQTNIYDQIRYLLI